MVKAGGRGKGPAIKKNKQNSPNSSDSADLESDYFDDGEPANTRGNKRKKTNKKQNAARRG